MMFGRVLLVLVLSLVLTATAHGQSPKKNPPKAEARQLDLSKKAWTGDFDQMLERRIIRAMVPYSRSLYFNDRGREMGISAETVRDFERWINKKQGKKFIEARFRQMG